MSVEAVYCCVYTQPHTCPAKLRIIDRNDYKYRKRPQMYHCMGSPRSVGSEEEPQHQPVLVPADETYNAAKPFIFYSFSVAL